MNKRLRKAWRRLRYRLRRHPQRFLRRVSGVIHVGAHTGQERDIYDRYGVNVLWIEAHPEVFARLAANVRDLPRQRALQGLVTDRNDREYRFHIAGNDGASSSIFDLNLHRDIWPDIRFVDTITLRSRTLPALLSEAGIDASAYDALVLDTQGSELLILQGAMSLLASFRVIQTEAADFAAYCGGCLLTEIGEFLARHGFREVSRHRFARHPSGGSYFDVIFERRIPRKPDPLPGR